jgi:hypothetical protein
MNAGAAPAATPSLQGGIQEEIEALTSKLV